jgi:hypothetical protein
MQPAPCTPRRQRTGHGPAFVLLVFGALCQGPARSAEQAVRLVPDHPNVVSFWNGIANQTVLASGSVNATAEEQRPSYQVDLATVHVAIYDAVVAIDGRFKAFAVTPVAPAVGASLDAAASAAACGVLRVLFPDRGAVYEAACEQQMAAVPPGEAKARGLTLGAEVAAAIVKLRANDGRSVDLPPYAPSTVAGVFRSVGPNPFNRQVPFIKPFALQRLDQFRPGPPPALSSPAYAAAVQVTRLAGGTVSASRSPEQLEIARFHSEPPGPFVTRNLGRFASTTANVVDAARLMAFIYVVHADAMGACFEAKYHYKAWRPLSAITLADSDGNDATVADAAWTPVLPTPNHPEYPAAHSCTAGGLGETLFQYFGTRQVAYSFDSKATGSTHSYASTEALNDESAVARVHGGMHFDFSTAAGVQLGVQVAQWVAAHHFGRKE